MDSKDREILESLVEALTKQKSHQKELDSKYDIGDMAFKALTTITMMLTIWVVSSVSDMSATISNIKIDNEYTKSSVEQIKKFTEQPKFTLEDFNGRIEPIIKQLNANTSELNARSGFMEDTRNTLMRHDMRIETLEKKHAE